MRAAVPGLLCVTALLLALLLTRLVLAFLQQRAILDHPNPRSSHSQPTPRGGGWGILLTILPFWYVLDMPVLWLLAAGALMVVSWLDDRHQVPAAVRFAIHIAAVTTGLSVLAEPLMVALTPLQQALPLLIPPEFYLAALAFGWLWFVNLYNFMDGIDGLAGGETVSIGFSIAVIVAILKPAGSTADHDLLTPALVLAGAALGFLYWNWHPARLFMGDVGSIPLGFLLGGLLLALAARGAWASALLLPLYFLADATVTLLRRMLRGARFWQAHREHFYQRAVRAGLRHDQVTSRILCLNVVLLLLAILALSWPWLALAGGGVAVGLTLAWLGRRQTFHDVHGR